MYKFIIVIVTVYSGNFTGKIRTDKQEQIGKCSYYILNNHCSIRPHSSFAPPDIGKLGPGMFIRSAFIFTGLQYFSRYMPKKTVWIDTDRPSA
tara:strand:+ start:343 stop:621 length:279 start_codon:yes stop_codon:yes gene_type:complete